MEKSENGECNKILCERDRKKYLQKITLNRMGSFNSSPKINNFDSQDGNIMVPQGYNSKKLLHHIKFLQGEHGSRVLERCFLRQTSPVISEGLSDDFRMLELNSTVGCSRPLGYNGNTNNMLRILQWNLLSQSLGQHNDGFVKCPDEALTWDYRKYLIIEEILQHQPDIICLQEVDHYHFLEKMLGSVSYNGLFFPKPDSPCLYIEDNNGPDGCAIFYKTDKYELTNFEKRILKVWGVPSNHVALIIILKIKETS
ncbi:CCRN4L family protein [Megaselia abdita]